MARDDDWYEVDDPEPDLTLYCPNHDCTEVSWGAYTEHEYDTNYHGIIDRYACCPLCGTEGVEDNPHKEDKDGETD